MGTFVRKENGLSCQEGLPFHKVGEAAHHEQVSFGTYRHLMNLMKNARIDP